MPLPDKPMPHWIYPTYDAQAVEAITEALHIHPILAHILLTRGVSDPEEIRSYFYSQLPDLEDPRKFLFMDQAVERIVRALREEEAILIYGDNDVDGMTGTALLTEFIKRVGGTVHYYIPQHNIPRPQLFDHTIEFAQEHQCRLLITVDCGITAHKELSKVQQAGIDVIITDHHEPTEKLPTCCAILNPKLPQQTYPNRDLIGVGVAFKLAHAVFQALVQLKMVSNKRVDLKVYLDLVAIGTLADMGVLRGENRILVRYGLKQLHHTKRVGLMKLFQICSLHPQEAGPIEIACKIAPRLNSLGRIADPTKGVDLLLVRDEERAETLAKTLDLFNLERQKIEAQVSSEVDHLLACNPALLQNKALVLSAPHWHPGVIPIVASRIAKQYHRPTAIIAIDGEVGKGSIRTIKEFPLLQVLKKNADLFLNYGGHDFAAGITLPAAAIPKFTKRFLHAANSSLKDQDIVPKLYLDAPTDFCDLSYDLLSALELLEPYGNENPAPILYCRAQQTWLPKVIGGHHLKLYLEQGDRMLEGIAFGMAERRLEIQKKPLSLEIAYTPQINRFQNKSSIQLLIRDFRIATP